MTLPFSTSNFQTFIIKLGNLFVAGSPAYVFTTGLAYVIGITLVIIGLTKLNHHSKGPEQVPLSQPVGYVLAGILLVWLKVFINISHDSMFGVGSTPLSYTGTSPQGLAMWNALNAIFKFFGLVAIIRGIMQMRNVSSGGGQQQGGISKATIHIIGGVLLYYIDEFAKIAKGTFFP